MSENIVVTRKFIRRILLAGIILTISLLALACSRGDSSSGTIVPAFTGLKEQLAGLQQSGIWVSGEGEVMVVPDIVQLSLGVQAQAKTVAEAQRQAREAMDKVMTVLKTEGIAEKDIQTQSFRIEPVTKYDPKTNTSETIGYRVDNMVGVKIRKIADAGKIIDAVAEAGGDLARVRGVSFTVDDPKPYYVQARDKAMENAIAKAEQLAKAAKVKLGKPVFISEAGVALMPQRDLPPMPRVAGVAAPPTEISPGELKISLSLQVHFNIE